MKIIKEYSTADKSKWGRGEWDKEPDKIQYLEEKTGYDALIVRNPAGALCGYVGIPSAHPLHGKDYSEIDVDVHGGLTFANKCTPSANEAEHICHVPLPGREDHVWWFGFDCAHCDDFMPEYGHKWSAFERNCTYRNRGYVERQIKSLAKQLKGLEVSK